MSLFSEMIHTDSISLFTFRAPDEAIDPDVFLSDWDPLYSKLMSSKLSFTILHGLSWLVPKSVILYTVLTAILYSLDRFY